MKKIILSTLLLSLFLAPAAFAQRLSNDSYIIQMGNLNSFAGESEGDSYHISITGGQTGPGLYSGTNYKVKSGFQYVRPKDTDTTTTPGGIFSFSISQTEIDFGSLTPTNPVTRANTLTINNTSSPTYTVTARQNHPLQSATSGAIIPDTTCDNGSCNETTAAAWSNTLTYGYGYRCDKVSTNYCPTTFTNSAFYKQFADNSKGESAKIVMSGTQGSNQRSQITYKVNISSSQQAGLYTNTVTYIATPGF